MAGLRMLIFINDDSGCLTWLNRRPNSALVEGMRDRTGRRLLLHAAACSRLRNALRRSLATTADRWVAAALHAPELVEWCLEEYGVEPVNCPNCAASETNAVDTSSVGATAVKQSVAKPGAAGATTAASTGDDDENRPIPRLGRDILNYVLDVAIIHLEPDVRPYHLTVGDVAQCLRKTPRQLAATFERLVDEGLLAIGQAHGRGPDRDETRPIHPTADALRTLEYYASRDRRTVNRDLAKLHEADPEGAPAAHAPTKKPAKTGRPSPRRTAVV
jgi:hypothetical protein